MASAEFRLPSKNGEKWWSNERLCGHKLLTGGPWTLIRALKFSGTVLIAIVAVELLWLALLDWNAMRCPVARYASARLHRTVQIVGTLNVHLFTLKPHIVATGVMILSN